MSSFENTISTDDLNRATAMARRIGIWHQRESVWLRFARLVEARCWQIDNVLEGLEYGPSLTSNEIADRFCTIDRRVKELSAINDDAITAIEDANLDTEIFYHRRIPYVSAHRFANVALRAFKSRHRACMNYLDSSCTYYEIQNLESLNDCQKSGLLNAIYSVCRMRWKRFEETSFVGLSDEQIIEVVRDMIICHFDDGYWKPYDEPKSLEPPLFKKAERISFNTQLLIENRRARQYLEKKLGQAIQRVKELRYERSLWFEEFTSVKPGQLRKAASNFRHDPLRPTMRSRKISSGLSEYCVQDAKKLWPHLMKGVAIE